MASNPVLPSPLNSALIAFSIVCFVNFSYWKWEKLILEYFDQNYLIKYQAELVQILIGKNVDEFVLVSAQTFFTSFVENFSSLIFLNIFENFS